MLEKNYRTYCSLNGIPLDDGLVDAKDGDMDLDEDGDDDWNGIDDDNDMEINNDDAPDFFKEMNSSLKSGKTPSRRPKTKVGLLVRQKIQRVLDETGLGEKRASKIDETDFLSLLHAFNQEGIHFA
jgi:18S rRNA (adenine1779-N6/adenine1780-N6)-dimethyltransferase